MKNISEKIAIEIDDRSAETYPSSYKHVYQHIMVVFVDILASDLLNQVNIKQTLQAASYAVVEKHCSLKGHTDLPKPYTLGFKTLGKFIIKYLSICSHRHFNL